MTTSSTKVGEPLLHELLVLVFLVNDDVAVGFFNDVLDSLLFLYVFGRYRETIALAMDVLVCCPGHHDAALAPLGSALALKVERLFGVSLSRLRFR